MVTFTSLALATLILHPCPLIMSYVSFFCVYTTVMHLACLCSIHVFYINSVTLAPLQDVCYCARKKEEVEKKKSMQAVINAALSLNLAHTPTLPTILQLTVGACLQKVAHAPTIELIIVLVL